MRHCETRPVVTNETVRRDGTPEAETTRDPLLLVRDVSVRFARGRWREPLTALNAISIEVNPGETLGVVGESGSGKSTLGRAILGLVPIQSGQIEFEGQDVTHVSAKVRRAMSRDLQVVFQDPFSSLNPSKRVGVTLAEPLLVHQKLSRSEANDVVRAMLERVGLSPSMMEKFPGQFSGGQRQRIAIARALMVSPKLIICDEPVSALDLSIQAQVLNLLVEIQREFKLSYLFIAHDLAVVNHVSHRIVVIYRGEIMEQGTADEVYRTPAHPYTRALLEASPLPDPRAQRERIRSASSGAGRVAENPLDGIGCVFQSRCPYVIDLCRHEKPTLHDARSACHRYDELKNGFVEIRANGTS
jgi:oligopeptide/dipeptide ABC transporter ATP-binding protein